MRFKFKERTLNLILVALVGVACIGLFRVWRSAPSLKPLTENKSVAKELIEKRKLRPLLYSYNIVVEKDLFLPSRYRDTALPRAGGARHTGTLQVPRELVLVGTVLLSDKKLAIMVTNKAKGKSASYKIGDSIAGFTVKGIERDKVVLGKFGQTAELILKGTKYSGAMSSANSRLSSKKSLSGNKPESVPVAPVRRPQPFSRIGQKSF